MQADRSLDFYINRALKKMDLGDFATEVEVDRAYRSVVGDLISRLTLSLRYANGTLRLRLTSAALKQEIMLRRETLRQAINHRIGHEAVKKIILV